METLSNVQRKASLWIINTSSIPSLIKRIQRAPTQQQDDSNSSETEQFSSVAKVALTFVSKHCPTVYKPHVGEFAKALADEKNAQLGEVALQALAAVRWEGSERYGLRYTTYVSMSTMIPQRRMRDRIVKYALGANVRHAKFAGRLIGHMKDEELSLKVVNVRLW